MLLAFEMCSFLLKLGVIKLYKTEPRVTRSLHIANGLQILPFTVLMEIIRQKCHTAKQSSSRFKTDEGEKVTAFMVLTNYETFMTVLKR